MYAIHLGDLMMIGQRFPVAYPFLFSGIVTNQPDKLADGSIDGIVMLCEDDITLDRLEALRDLLELKGWKRHVFRVYEQGPKGGWKKVIWPKRLPERGE